VSVSGDTAVLGAVLELNWGRGAAYAFVRNAGVWGPQQELTALRRRSGGWLRHLRVGERPGSRERPLEQVVVV